MGMTDAHGSLPGFAVNSIERYTRCLVCSGTLILSASRVCRLCKSSVHPSCADNDGFCHDCAPLATEPRLEFFHDETMGQISGFGGFFEVQCQKMLNSGVHWLRTNAAKRAILSNKSRLAKEWRACAEARELRQAMLCHVRGINPLMADAVFNRLVWIAGHGWKAYRLGFRKLEFRWPTIAEGARHADR